MVSQLCMEDLPFNFHVHVHVHNYVCAVCAFIVAHGPLLVSMYTCHVCSNMHGARVHTCIWAPCTCMGTISVCVCMDLDTIYMCMYVEQAEAAMHIHKPLWSRGH